MMDRTPLLLLALAALAPAPAAAQLQGSTSTAISAQPPSWLGGLDLQDLETAACGRSGDIRGTVLVITADGGGGTVSTLTLEVLETSPDPATGTALATVQPTSLHFAGGSP